MGTIYETVKTTFNEFINVLLKTEQGRRRVLWRGERNSNWALVPSLFRVDGRNILKIINGEEKQGHISDLLLAEAQLLYNFYLTCKRIGLEVPEVPLFEEMIDDYDANISFVVLFKRHNPDPYCDIFNTIDGSKECRIIGRNHSIEQLATIAQHYGVPTRLIDWSYDMNVALYFAAQGAIKEIVKTEKCSEEKEMAIWTFDMTATEQYFKPKKGIEFLRIINSPYIANRNQQSQNGLLMYNNIGHLRNLAEQDNYKSCVESGGLNSQTLWMSIIENGISYCQEFNTKHYNVEGKEYIAKPTIPLKKYVLSYMELPQIINYLDAIDANTARYFPDYEHVYKHIQETTLRDTALMILKQTRG